ncbi:GDP-L-fucose synthase family protein [Gordonia sp. WA4-43]|uniref:GDP-L-fucose synthase family protein n=1 Tax=Gordonia sp. WA4-43 TaxID=2878678 RepID=UPI001CF9E590|nr:NAD-dependent epimerase/dehydratase family protein [Gordonia sp. WA4-43]UCZ91855.1 GDP-L-fucose synthase [Gordonia sp. WA4-43]
MSNPDGLRALDSAAKVYVAGHRGLVGSALVRAFQRRGFTDVVGKSSAELDLRDRDATFAYFAETKPDVVLLAAARVGGIAANSSRPVDFLSDNLRIQVNVLDAALAHDVPRLLFLGSSCIYPKFAEQPIREDSLLTGLLEPTNDAYAIAKIAGIMQVQAVRRQYGLPWISAMPTNLYGPNDNFSPTNSHLLPAMIRRYESARVAGADSVTNWGTGTPKRELLHVDDMADASLHLLEHYDGYEQVNIGTGVDHSIAEIADIVANAVGFVGGVEWDTSKPDGTPRKLLDVTHLRALGWKPSIPLERGVEQVVQWYRTSTEHIRV